MFNILIKGLIMANMMFILSRKINGIIKNYKIIKKVNTDNKNYSLSYKPSKEFFKFTINSGDDSSFSIPVMNGSATKADNSASYTWIIDWGDGTTEESSGNAEVYKVIPHTYSETNKNYQITIRPKNQNELGWGKAFGFFDELNDIQPKIISLDSPITKNMWFDNGTNVGVGAWMFCGCTNLTMGPEFNLPQDITSVGDGFGVMMFTSCTNLTMNNIFNLPQNLTSVGSTFGTMMFGGCTNLTMNDIFNLPQNITSVGAGGGFVSHMFTNCTKLTMNDIFNLPQNITGNIGNTFCMDMFSSCPNLTMNDIFNLPQNITGNIENNFCDSMFTNCTKLTMNDIFNLPQNITSVGYSFCSSMFYNCSKLTMGEKFNLPQDITSVGQNFCNRMFNTCPNLTMNDIFNLPQNISGNIENSFCDSMFSYCTNLTMNNIFDLPQNISGNVGNNFCSGMFGSCTNLTMNNIFNLPQNITSVGQGFCSSMFNTCQSITTGIQKFFSNLILPQSELDKSGVFYRAFSNCSSITKEISADTIPQLSVIPSSNNNCFSDCPESAIKFCPTNWGGKMPNDYKIYRAWKTTNDEIYYTDTLNPIVNTSNLYKLPGVVDNNLPKISSVSNDSISFNETNGTTVVCTRYSDGDTVSSPTPTYYGWKCINESLSGGSALPERLPWGFSGNVYTLTENPQVGENVMFKYDGEIIYIEIFEITENGTIRSKYSSALILNNTRDPSLDTTELPNEGYEIIVDDEDVPL